LIIFIHGDNQLQSREKLNQLIADAKKKDKEIIRLDGLKINLSPILQALESVSLFGQEKLIVIENLFSRQKSKKKKKITNYLKKQTIKPDLILWEKKKISGTITRWLPKQWKFLEFKTSAVIFKFLDSFKPDNQKQIYKFLKKSILQNNEEMVFYMLAKRVKDLIIAKDLGEKGLKGAPWQKGKLINQAKCFTIENLKEIYQYLLKIDFDIKTGSSFMDLDWHLDILTASI